MTWRDATEGQGKMTSGGARSRSGPPPDPNALSRDRKDDKTWTTLPQKFAGAMPAWPLTESTGREDELWSVFWAKPQATLWERNGQLFEVAIHVRTFAEAERPDASSSLRTLLRQQADALLLTIPAMLAARIRIAADEVAAKRTEHAAAEAAPPRTSSRARLKKPASGGI